MSRLVKKIKKCAVCSALSRQSVFVSMRIREGAHTDLPSQCCPKCGYTSCDIGKVCEASVKKRLELKKNGKLCDPTVIEIKRKGRKNKFGVVFRTKNK